MNPEPPCPEVPVPDDGLREFTEFLASELDPGDLRLDPAARDELLAAFRRQPGAIDTEPQPWECSAIAFGESPARGPHPPLDPAARTAVAEMAAFGDRLRQHLDPGDITLTEQQRQEIHAAIRRQPQAHELTAWALGELEPERFFAVESALARSPALRAEALSLRAFCNVLWRFTRVIPRPTHTEERRIRRLFAPSANRRATLTAAGIAAAAALLAVARFFLPSPHPAQSVAQSPPAVLPPTSERPFPATPDHSPTSNPPVGPPVAATTPQPVPALAETTAPPAPTAATPAASPPPAADNREIARTTNTEASRDEEPSREIAAAPAVIRPTPPAAALPERLLPSLDPTANLPSPAGDLPLLANLDHPTPTNPHRPRRGGDDPAFVPSQNNNTATIATTRSPAASPNPGFDFAAPSSIRLTTAATDDNSGPVDPPDITETDPGNLPPASDPTAVPPLAPSPNHATLALAGLQPYLLSGLNHATLALPSLTPPKDNGFSWGASAGFQLLEYDALIGSAGFRADTWAGSAAASFPLSDTLRLGTGVTRLDSRAEVDAFGDVNLSSSAAAWWLDWQPSNWRVSLLHAFTSFDQDLFRQDAATWHRANQDAELQSLSLSVSRLSECGPWHHGPLVTADAAWGQLDGYLEAGPAPLAVAGHSFHSLFTLVGWQFIGSFGPLSPHATLGWRHALDLPQSTTVHSSPGGIVGATTANPARNSLVCTTGLRWNTSDHLALDANWLVEWRGSNSIDQSLSLSLIWNF